MRFLRELHKKFEGKRQQLLAKRRTLQLQIDAGNYTPDFDPDTKGLRDDQSWHGASIPKDMQVKKSQKRFQILKPLTSNNIFPQGNE